jgi:hypothetical protein
LLLSQSDISMLDMATIIAEAVERGVKPVRDDLMILRMRLASIQADLLNQPWAKPVKRPKLLKR